MEPKAARLGKAANFKFNVKKMKKLMLDPNAFDAGEVLTRAELKKVMGGFGSSVADCNEDTDCNYVDAKGSLEPGLCSQYMFQGDDGRPHAECFCKTKNHQEPSTLSSNGGVSKCKTN